MATLERAKIAHSDQAGRVSRGSLYRALEEFIERAVSRLEVSVFSQVQ